MAHERLIEAYTTYELYIENRKDTLVHAARVAWHVTSRDGSLLTKDG